MDLALKLLGWVLAGVPLLAFLFISAAMVYQIGKNDSAEVKVLSMLGVMSFFLGALILGLMYLTDISFG